ncbi:uncharacterized protein PRCAT00003969001 [Priceomyces carsonii]|uniref:uncharacterized protein n=1 Tax=Priceomyces carsonii TaxID=28549 RepID=UPI002ED7A67A|nr:unnamed protein product [Priceomyces carsonii]
MASRDLPTSFKELTTGWLVHAKREITFNKSKQELIDNDIQDEDHEAVTKVQAKNLWPAFVSGAGLFSDGYVNNSISTATYCLAILYEDAYTNSNAISNVSSIAFAGTVVGMLVFGYISDNFARKGGMMTANVMLIFFTALCAAGSWGLNGSPYGLFAALTTFRFFLGIAIGAEYPTSSVIASEFANQLPSGKRNRYFIWFTNAMIDVGYVVSSFVPMVLLWICTPKHLTPIWRITLALGAILPISLFFMRLKIKDSEAFQKMNMKKAKVPYWTIIKFYWFRLIIVSLIWFLYDFSAYSFGVYSSFIIGKVVGDGDMYKTFGWTVVFNLFYIPGAFLGALGADYLGPRVTAGVGVILQAAVGYIMAGCFPHLKHSIGGFVVVYGIFTSLGEFGPGDNIGLLAAKTSATTIRGQYYGIAAAVGKIGAFVGTWVFPVIQKNALKARGSDFEMQAPFYVSSSLCVFSGILIFFFLPAVGQDAVNREDQEFFDYLEATGYDTRQLGYIVDPENDSASTDEVKKTEVDVKVEAESKTS